MVGRIDAAEQYVREENREQLEDLYFPYVPYFYGYTPLLRKRLLLLCSEEGRFTFTQVGQNLVAVLY